MLVRSHAECAAGERGACRHAADVACQPMKSPYPQDSWGSRSRQDWSARFSAALPESSPSIDSRTGVFDTCRTPIKRCVDLGRCEPSSETCQAPGRSCAAVKFCIRYDAGASAIVTAISKGALMGGTSTGEH